MGFRVVDELARRRGVALGGEECGARVGEFADPGRVERPAGEAGSGGPAAGGVEALDLAAGADVTGGAAGEGGAASAGEVRPPGEDSALRPGVEPVPEPPGVILLVQPQTYMNRSGYTARCLAELHGLSPADILVVYDEVNLPLGRLRLRRGGSPAGHRGMESILENLRTDEVPRLRLGVAPEAGPPPGADLAEFVLGPFHPEEQEAAEALIHRAADACEAWLTEGVDAAMNQFNR